MNSDGNDGGIQGGLPDLRWIGGLGPSAPLCRPRLRAQPAGTGFGGRVLAVSAVTAVMGPRELWGDVLGHSL
jgi:hypothetical protein